MHGKGNRWIVWIAIIGMFIALCGCSNQDEQAEEQQPVYVKVEPVKEGEVKRVARINGTVFPQQEVKIIPKIGGKVTSVKVDVGDHVQPGQVLLQLDTTDLEVKIKQAQAGLAAARANLAQLEAGTRAEDLEMAKVAFDNAKTNLERVQYLFEQGAVPQNQLDQAQLSFDNARVSYEKAQKGATKEQRQAAEAGVKQAQAALEQAQVALKDATITCPQKGVVTARYIEAGEMAGPSTPVLVISQLNPAVVQVYASPSEVNYLRVGDKVKVKLSSIEESREGRITAVSPGIDRSKYGFLMKVKVPNDDGKLKSGMSAVVEVVLETVKTIRIPQNALVDRDEQPVVFVADGETAKKRVVKLGLKGEEYQAVTGGLKLGEKLIVRGQEYLSEGDKIMVSNGGQS